MNDWLILRTASSCTMAVATALDEAGYRAWTPSRQERSGPARARVLVPLMPTFVFADYDCLADLIALSKSPSLTYRVWDAEQGRMVNKGIPHFRLFRFLDGYPRLRDRALNPLRQTEQRHSPETVGPRFEPDDKVLYPDAGFEGLTPSCSEPCSSTSLATRCGCSMARAS